MALPASRLQAVWGRRLETTSGRLLAVWLIAIAAGFTLEAGEMGSAHYSIQHATLDAGGGGAASGRYRLVSSTAAFGGLAVSTGGGFADRSGFAGVLNDPPQGVPDTVLRPPDQPMKVRVSALLANDTDPEADRFVLRGFASPTAVGGRVSLDNGWLLYEPPAAFTGADSFTYAIEDDAGNVASALVTVLVAGTGPAPSQNLVAITLLPNGHRRISFAGIARRRYAIEWTDVLPASRWELLAHVDADARGMIEWVDTTEPSPSERYYRTVAE